MTKGSTKIYSSNPYGISDATKELENLIDPVEFKTVYRVTFAHIYKTVGFLPDADRRHMCLTNGYWCFQNLREYPQDLIGFVKRKLFNKKATR